MNLDTKENILYKVFLFVDEETDKVLGWTLKEQDIEKFRKKNPEKKFYVEVGVTREGQLEDGYLPKGVKDREKE